MAATNQVQYVLVTEGGNEIRTMNANCWTWGNYRTWANSSLPTDTFSTANAAPWDP